ncbi:MAG: hypothetical protein J7L38_06495 [Thermoproteales archaeon]|nr:hypothetical protein [Thermoproteales archaeon]
MVEKSFGLNFRYMYIHAELLTEQIPPSLQVNLQLNMPTGKPSFENETLILPFTLNFTTIPAVANITLRGIVKVSGKRKFLEEIKNETERKKPIKILPVILQHLMFEVMLIGREIGLPPILMPAAMPPKSPREPSSMIA